MRRQRRERRPRLPLHPASWHDLPSEALQKYYVHPQIVTKVIKLTAVWYLTSNVVHFMIAVQKPQIADESAPWPWLCCGWQNLALRPSVINYSTTAGPDSLRVYLFHSDILLFTFISMIELNTVFFFFNIKYVLTLCHEFIGVHINLIF